jgi:hypothetical protein
MSEARRPLQKRRQPVVASISMLLCLSSPKFDGFQGFDEAGGVVVEVIDAVGAVEG